MRRVSQEVAAGVDGVISIPAPSYISNITCIVSVRGIEITPAVTSSGGEIRFVIPAAHALPENSGMSYVVYSNGLEIVGGRVSVARPPAATSGGGESSTRVVGGQIEFKDEQGVWRSVTAAPATPTPAAASFPSKSIGVTAGYYNRTVGVTGANFYNKLIEDEALLGVKFPHVNNYEGVSATSAADYNSEVNAILTADQSRTVIYVIEPWGSLADINNQIDAESGPIYTNMVDIFGAIASSGPNQFRVVIAPMHECNGSTTYPWQIYAAGNSSSLYVTVFRKIVDLARANGVQSKFMQWFITSNSGGSAAEYSTHYAGAEYVDIFGISYYNRYSVDYNYWEPVGHNLRDAYRLLERANPNTHIWIGEAGCAPEGSSGNSKSAWMEDLYKFVGSGELPNIRAVHLFAVDNSATTGDWSLRSQSHREAVVRGLESLPSKNLVRGSVERTNTISPWQGQLTGQSVVPGPVVGGKTLSALKFSKPASAGTDRIDYHFYDYLEESKYVPGRSYSISFYAKANANGVKLDVGIKQDSAPGTFIGDNAIQITTEWKEYHVQIASSTVASGPWRAPYFAFGHNAAATDIEFSGVRFAEGSKLYSTPTPSTEFKVVDNTVQFRHSAQNKWNRAFESAEIFNGTGPQSALGATIRRGAVSPIIQVVGDSTTFGDYSWPAKAIEAVAKKFANYNLHIVQWYQASSAAPIAATSRYRSYRTMQTGTGGIRYCRYQTGTPSAGPHSIPVDPALTSTAIDVRVRVALDNWATGTQQVIVARWGNNTANGRQFFTAIGGDGSMRAGVSVDGNANETTVVSSVIPALTAGQPVWIRYTIEANNAGTRLYRFFTGAESGVDNITWTQVGTDRTATGTASFNPTCTEPISFGARYVSTAYQEKPIGNVYWVDVRSGGIADENGEIVCPPLLERWNYTNTASLADSNVLYLGSPSIVIYGGGLPGQEIGIFSNATIFNKLHPVGVRPDEFWINDGHNEGVVTNTDWADTLDTYINAVEARYAPTKKLGYVVAAQNPVVPDAIVVPPITGGFSQAAIRKREIRHIVLRAVASGRPKWKIVDSTPAFLNKDGSIVNPALWNPDGLHPSSALGGAAQGRFIARQIFPDIMGFPDVTP